MKPTQSNNNNTLPPKKPKIPNNVFFFSPCFCRDKNDDTSGEDNDEKETVTSKGRKTANSQGRRKGRITRSMANEANNEEAATPQQSAELGRCQGMGGTLPWAGPSGYPLCWDGTSPCSAPCSQKRGSLREILLSGE